MSHEIDAALRELRQTVAATRAALARVQSHPTTTPEERRELQAQARSGTLGSDMETIARHVETGETSWPEVFESISPDTDLLRGHLERMVEQHAPAVRRQLLSDPGFDPLAPHQGL
jgi:hypothetical protein